MSVGGVAASRPWTRLLCMDTGIRNWTWESSPRKEKQGCREVHGMAEAKAAVWLRGG